MTTGTARPGWRRALPGRATFGFLKHWRVGWILPANLLWWVLTPRQPFFPASAAAGFAELAAQWPLIRDEYLAARAVAGRVPSFSDVEPGQQRLAGDGGWRALVFRLYGNDLPHNMALMPRTWELLSTIPRLETAMISVLEPGKVLPLHAGAVKAVLRVHLGLIVPEPRESSGIKVGGQLRHWEPGGLLVFDDTHLHTAWNHSPSERVVLFCDVARQTRFAWLDRFGDFVLRRLSRHLHSTIPALRT